ncbi:RICIN domain-containing protein [Streptomyces sp. NPDC001606]
MMKKHISRLVVAVTAVAASTILSSPAAHASAPKVTWHDDATGKYLVYQPNTESAVETVDHTWYNGPYDWSDFQQSDGSYIETPYGVSNVCLTAYWDNSVYMENCKPNNDYERWYEEWQGNGWRLRNKATGYYLDSNASGSVYALPGNGGNYQLWH